MLVNIAISVAELIDRITICEVKLDHISDPEKRYNIKKEMDMLSEYLSAIELPDEIPDLRKNLYLSNTENFLQIEVVFQRDAAKDFGPNYVAAAQAAFRANAERARIKRKINLIMSSEILEEKTY